MSENEQLPSGWCRASLTDLAEINPPHPEAQPADDDLVSFIPMAAVEAMTGHMDTTASRPWSTVKKGYKRFQNNDVLFAKITPCMENGKAAVANGLLGGAGAGSTEFHVLRPFPALRAELLLYYFLQTNFRKTARSRMTGTAGQLRFPSQFLEEQTFPLPPGHEQERIVEAIESYFTRLDDATATLERVQRSLKRYRASVLKAAVEGRLVPTEAELARKEGRDYEPASALLEHILAKRRRRWEEAELAKMKAKGKVPKNDKWKAKYKDPTAPDTTDLPELPEGWCWATPDEICEALVDCPHSTPKWSSTGRVCVRTTEFQPGFLDLSGARYVSEEVFNERTKRLRPREGDVLYSREGGILGIACSVPAGVDLCMGQRMMLMRTYSPIPHEYLVGVLNSPLILRIVRRLTSGSASPHVNVRDVRSFPIPLPPMTESRRIIDCVDALLCAGERIEHNVARNLLRAKRLRQSILKWAFEGRLVDQDPDDEPASALLERIKAEREASKPKRTTRPRRRKKAQ